MINYDYLFDDLSDFFRLYIYQHGDIRKELLRTFSQKTTLHVKYPAL